MIKKSIVCILVLFIVACSSKKPNENAIVVGTISGPETQLMEVAKKVAAKRYHLDVQIVPFSDYNAPNLALDDKSINANVFQHKAFLDAQTKARNLKLVAIGKTFLYPMAIYSHKLKSLAHIPEEAKVAIPNDPTNEGRALLLLQKAGLITLKPGVGANATPIDIIKNPKKLRFIELDAAELPRSLNDVTIATITTTYAIPAGLSPLKDSLLREGVQSPFVNLIVVRAQDKQNKKLQELVKAYQSPQVERAAQRLFGDAAIPGWK